ncbi:MAG TPA: hypothetical protein VMV84_06005 [Dehalococcoidales bacterium]|nr:hypothetical protein [Dehalococcoidales bacterium]
MSKFIDRLNWTAQTTPHPIGFKQAHTASEKPRMLLVASLAQAHRDNVADYMAGADAGLLPIPELSSGAKEIQEMSQLVPAIPWGGWLRDTNRGETKPMVTAGCDFVVFPATDTFLAVPQDDKAGKILEVEASLREGLLGTVNELPVDAVLVTSEPGEDYSLTWHHLMLFQRFADLLTKPLLVPVPPTVTANELKVLWEIGVDSVIIEVGGDQPPARLKELRQAIKKLTFPPQRKRGKVEALLPRISGSAETVTEEEEEEEDL